MNKPTYYLWKDSSCSDSDFYQRKETLSKCGFRVVIFEDGEMTDGQECIKSMLKNRQNAR